MVDDNSDDPFKAFEEDIIESDLVDAEVSDGENKRIGSTESIDTKDINPRVLSLKSKNYSIKLDLWLRYCVDEAFLSNFLRYRITDARGDKETLINRIISSFDLKSLINFKYKNSDSEFKSILESYFKPIKVVEVVEIATKYGVDVSLSKDALINGFLEKFYPYDLLHILNNEGLVISDFLKISILEQIYLLNDSDLKKLSDKCPNIGDSTEEMISCIVNRYPDGLLISNNILDLERI